MTKQQRKELKFSKQLGNAIVLLHMAGVMTGGERHKISARYVRLMAKRGVTVTRVNLAGVPLEATR